MANQWVALQYKVGLKGPTGGIVWFGAIAYDLSSILDSLLVRCAGLRKEAVMRACIVAASSYERSQADNVSVRY